MGFVPFDAVICTVKDSPMLSVASPDVIPVPDAKFTTGGLTVGLMMLSSPHETKKSERIKKLNEILNTFLIIY
jgi:hypothetical protein